MFHSGYNLTVHVGGSGLLRAHHDQELPVKGGGKKGIEKTDLNICSLRLFALYPF